MLKLKKPSPYSLMAVLILAIALSGCGGGKGGGMTYTPGQSITCTVGSGASAVSFNMHYVPGAAGFPTGIPGDPGTGSVSIAYWMAETEVTYQLWAAVCLWATDDAREPNRYYFQNSGTGEGNQYPVTTVSWRDAMVWCNALSEMAGLTPVYKFSGMVVRDSQDSNADSCDGVTADLAAKGFRLPTNNEWELAARYQNGTNWTPGNHVSGDTTSYCYPSDAGTSTVFGNYAWYEGNRGSSTTHPVGEKTANALNLHDMSGNVWEWCFDWYPGSEGSERVSRSGSWFDTVDVLRLGMVIGDNPSSKYDNQGFRPVRTQ